MVRACWRDPVDELLDDCNGKVVTARNTLKDTNLCRIDNNDAHFDQIRAGWVRKDFSKQMRRLEIP